MPDFLLELLSEEIPARMQEKAAKDLAFLLGEELLRAGLRWGEVASYGTPRRLAVVIRDLPFETDALSEEIKGPRADAPPQALAGFLGKTGLTRDQLVERPDARGNTVLFAVIRKPGRATAEVLAQAIPAVIRAFPWPKSMRWGGASADTASLRWVRPLRGVVALLGEEVVPVEIAGVASGAATVGHRFHHPGPITIGSADDYEAKLRACHVVLDPEERKSIIRDAASAAAAAQGLSVVPDEGLVAENAGLTEWPVPLLGAFDPAFLDLPREVIQLTMRTNQKYFACVDGSGQLAPAFICTANIDAADGGAAIVAGNQRVLSARLADARFFWEQDLKVPLAKQAKKLDQIVFHEKLGTVADKVERVAKLARWLVEEGTVTPLPLAGGAEPPKVPATRSVVGMAAEGGGGLPPSVNDNANGERQPTPNPSREREGDQAALADMAETAARLCKADLVTGMVGEFPELQGIIGGYYALAEGYPPSVADAIRDHYKPVGQGDDVPTAPVTVAVSLADKLDTLASFFWIKEYPTGSRDPFALRRAALGIVALILRNDIRGGLARYFEDTSSRRWLLSCDFSEEEIDHLLLERRELRNQYGAEWTDQVGRALRGPLTSVDDVVEKFEVANLSFLIDRLKVQQREAGVRHDLIDAVFALGGEDDLVRLLARVRALQSFIATDDGVNLLAGYKRAANILRIEEKRDGISFPSATHIGYEPLPEESALVAALDRAEPAAEAAIGVEDFGAAMTALSGLRGPVDAFFDKVTVNDPDTVKRRTRLGLLARIRDAVHRVADFSRIEG